MHVRSTSSFFFCWALSLTLLVPPPALAEDSEKSKGFYDKNFAETPLKRREGGRFPDGSFPTPKAAQLPVSPDNPLGMSEQEMQKFLKEVPDGAWKEMGVEKPTIAPMKSEETTPGEGDLTGLQRALPVRSIGGVVNSLDAEHYAKSLQTLTEFAIAKNLDIGTIYTLGDMKIATDSPLVTKVVARGGVVHIVSNVPKGYDVNLSPTWIVKTDEGEILLEAVGPLEKYFNQAGQFLDREKRAKKPAKAS